MERGNHDIDRGGYHDVASHIAPLALAIRLYGWPVLEIGCGWYSTPLIACLVGIDGVVTIESDRAWASRFESIHPIEVSESVVEATKIATSLRTTHTPSPWNVVFIDSAKAEDRIACAKLCLKHKCCIVIHDSQEPYWQDLLKTVKFQRHFDFMSPRTSFISNVIDVTKE